MPELNKVYRIDIDGKLNLTNIGNVYVRGLNTSKLEELLNKKYEEYIIDPDIKILIKEYRPLEIYLHGEITNPGMYTLSQYSKFVTTANNGHSTMITKNQSNFNNERGQFSSLKHPKLFDAIKAAGGVTFFSDLKNVEVLRNDPISKGGKIKATINFLDVIESGNADMNIRLYDGDIIYIKETNEPISTQLTKAIKTNLNPKFIDVMVSGRVENPGNIVASKASTLNDAIEIAGGKKALSGKVTYISFKGDGSIIKRKFLLNKKAKRGGKKSLS